MEEISSFDVYSDGNKIHLLMAGKKSATDKESSIYYSQTLDGGANWREPAKLGNFPPTIAVRGNDVQIAATGDKLIVIWQTKGELPGMGPLTSAYSTDDGKTWTAGANPAANQGGDQSHHDVIADGRGHFHVVWLEDPEENGYQSLRYANTGDLGAHWSSAKTLDDSTCSCCWNTLARSPEGRLAILYRDMKPRDMTLIQSENDGQIWQRSGIVGNFGWQFDGCPHNGGGLAYGQSGKSGEMHSLVWTGLEAKAGMYYLHSADHGKTWTKPKRLGQTPIHGDITVNGDKVTAIWDEMTADGSVIYVANTTGDLAAFNPYHLKDVDLTASHPRLASTIHGVTAFWTEKPAKKSIRLMWRIVE